MGKEERVKIASIILCAGASSRLKSATSKILHEICGRPVAYWAIKHALETTNTKPIVVVGHQADRIKLSLTSYFSHDLEFAYQAEPNGTGGAVMAAIPHLDKDCQSVLIVCGDTPLLKKESIANLVMIQQNSHVPIAMLSAKAPDPTGYGRIIRNDAQHVVNIIEDRDTSPLEREITEVNPAVYVFDGKFLRENIGKLQATLRRGEFYLTDLVATYIKDGASHFAGLLDDSRRVIYRSR
jgi:bifunctional N-acetylglucosamine-1-phosphate-uridyltransferase/glucosamine-1-phosphate-acetyltransferase GlmU-like protein